MVDRNILTDRICGSGLYFYWPNALHWNFLAGRSGISLLTESVVLEYPYLLTILSSNILYWNILAHEIFCTGIFLLTHCFVLEYPY
jgi:hypothetical protein